MYYLDEINFVECKTYEEAEESVMTAFDDDEIIDRAMLGRMHDILDELKRLESPLYWELYENAKDGFLNNYLTEMEDDEPCCEDCGHSGADKEEVNCPCFWCEEYSEFKKKDW